MRRRWVAVCIVVMSVVELVIGVVPLLQPMAAVVFSIVLITPVLSPARAGWYFFY